MRPRERGRGTSSMGGPCRNGRASEGFAGEVICELGGVFSEVGSEAFCWEGNGTERGKEPLRRVVKSCTCPGGGGGGW